MKFTVVLHTDDGRRYGVTVPDLPGCFSVGDGMDEALESVREAIDLHAETLIEDGGVWAVVDVPVERYFDPAEKIDITLPRLLLAKIDEYAKAHDVTRSGFLAEAARSAMR